MANTSSKQAQPSDVTSGSTEAETTAVEKGQTQTFFVPEYNVSVEATSLEEAITLAKKAKGKN
ncbi:MAG: hypothetical protein ACYDAZ_08950 [Thermoplasmataceae archaeon]